MPQVYTLVIETSVGAPSLGSEIEYNKESEGRMSYSGCGGKEETASDREPLSQRELASLQKKERGERKPSDIMVETFDRPGHDSWAERAAASLMRKSSSKSKESTE